jgi:hypothetical protein
MMNARTRRYPRYAAAVIGAPGTTLGAAKAVSALFHAQALKERAEVRGERMT